MHKIIVFLGLILTICTVVGYVVPITADLIGTDGHRTWADSAYCTVLSCEDSDTSRACPDTLLDWTRMGNWPLYCFDLDTMWSAFVIVAVWWEDSLWDTTSFEIYNVRITGDTANYAWGDTNNFAWGDTNNFAWGDTNNYAWGDTNNFDDSDTNNWRSDTTWFKNHYADFHSDGDTNTLTVALVQSGLATYSNLHSILDPVLCDVAYISEDRAAADNLESMLDGTGGVDLDLQTLRITGGDTAIVISANDYGIFATADTAVRICGTNAALSLYSYIGTGIDIRTPVKEGIDIRAGSFGFNSHGIYLSGYGYSLYASNSYLAGKIEVDRVDSLGNPALEAIDTIVENDTIGLAREASLFDWATDSVLAKGGAIDSLRNVDIDTVIAVVGSVYTKGGIVDSAKYVYYLGYGDSIRHVDTVLYVKYADSCDVVVTVDSVLGAFVAPSPFAFATNRQRVANQNTPITWAQGEADSLRWDVDTTIDLTNAIAIFTAWLSYTDTSTVFYDTMNVDASGNQVTVWLPYSITDTLDAGNYPADVWVETAAGRELQIWYKTLRIDKSSRGSR